MYASLPSDPTMAMSSLGFKENSTGPVLGDAFGADTPSMHDVYDSSHFAAARQSERRMAGQRWQQSATAGLNGFERRPADRFSTTAHLQDGAPALSLTGQEIDTENFAHHNMQPYFRGSIKQNMKVNAFNTILENHTGRGTDYQSKQEVEHFFPTEQNMGGFVNGAPNRVEEWRSRVVIPKAMNNIFPIAQIRVGPGLGQGVDNNPIGGFQQANTLDYVRPKTIDELRPLTRQRTVMEGRVQGPGVSAVTNRGMLGVVSKERPETFWEQSPEQWLTTTGASLKQSDRAEVVLRDTAKVETHKDYMGGAQTGGAKPGVGDSDDFGKGSVQVYTNARDVTGNHSFVGGITSTVKALVAPLMDAVRRTPKEYFVEAPRTFGNMQATIPEKAEAYDPDTYQPRETIREQTTEAARVYGNMSAQIPEKATLYDPVTHVMRTTIKETTLQEGVVTNVKAGDFVQARTADGDAKTTHRETLPVEEVYRNVSGHTYRVITYSPDLVAKTTMKETTIDAVNPSGNVGGNTVGRKGAYEWLKWFVVPTQRQGLAKEHFGGVAGGTSKHVLSSRDAAENQRVDGTREALNIVAARIPTTEGAKVMFAKEGINHDVKKLAADSIAAREAGNAGSHIPVGPSASQRVTTTALRDDMEVKMGSRLDVNILSALKTNPYNHNVAPL